MTTGLEGIRGGEFEVPLLEAEEGTGRGGAQDLRANVVAGNALSNASRSSPTLNPKVMTSVNNEYRNHRYRKIALVVACTLATVAICFSGLGALVAIGLLIATWIVFRILGFISNRYKCANIYEKNEETKNLTWNEIVPYKVFAKERYPNLMNRFNPENISLLC